MTQPEPFPDFETRPPRLGQERSPIINLPVNAITEEADPTRELRALIEELQRTARESREEVHKTERENQRLLIELESASGDLLEARSREQELRSRFVEITSLIRERDTAQAAAARHLKSIADLQKQLDALTLENETLHKQRDTAVRQADAITQSATTSAAQLAQAQAQIIAIRQARDSTHTQNREYLEKLARAEDSIAELTYEQERATAAGQAAAQTIERLEAKLAAMEGAHTALLDLASTLEAQLEAQRRQVRELSEDHTAAAGAVQAAQAAHSAALAQLQEEALRSAAERDEARTRAGQLEAALQAARSELEALALEKNVPPEIALELETARRQLAAMPAEFEARIQAFSAEAALQEQRLAQYARELEQAVGQRQALGEAVTLAEARILALEAQREAQGADDQERSLGLQSQTAALQVRDDELQKDLAQARKDYREQEEKLRGLARQCEDHRMVATDLAGRLDAAQRQIIELTASLAEARLQVKFANSKAAKKPASRAAAPACAPEPEPEPESAGESSFELLSEKQCRSAVNLMRECQQSFERTPSDPSLLNELYCQAHGFSQRARASGFLGLHRLLSAFAALTYHLYQMPESISPTAIRTLHQAIEFFALVVRERWAGRLMDPVKARVFVVEPDPENRQMLGLGLEMALLEPECVSEVSSALAELAHGRQFNLLLVHADLPGMDGMELCSLIRDMGSHQHTPVLFVSAPDGPQISALERAGHDVLVSPINLHELGVKSLLLLLRAQLAGA